jgi:single-strand DNA-binding protein
MSNGVFKKSFLIGRLGQDPKKRITPGEHTAVNISLATTEYYKDQGGIKQERTEWHHVTFWNRLGEIMNSTAGKEANCMLKVRY